MMKFLLIVLLILFIGEVITNKMKSKATDDKGDSLKKTIHPAEYGLR